MISVIPLPTAMLEAELEARRQMHEHWEFLRDTSLAVHTRLTALEERQNQIALSCLDTQERLKTIEAMLDRLSDRGRRYHRQEADMAVDFNAMLVRLTESVSNLTTRVEGNTRLVEGLKAALAKAIEDARVAGATEEVLRGFIALDEAIDANADKLAAAPEENIEEEPAGGPVTDPVTEQPTGDADDGFVEGSVIVDEE